MTNILIASPTGALINGAERAGLSLMAHLTELGHRVVNAYPDHYENLDPDRFASYREAMEAAGVHPVPVDFGWWVPDDEEFALREFSAVARVLNIAQTHDIELVITNTTVFPWAALAAALNGVRHIWLLHEFPTGVFSWLADRYDFVADFSASVMCASPSLATDVARRIEATARVPSVGSFQPFSDVAHVQLAPQESPRIVVVGSIDKRKNQLEVVEALEYLRAEGHSPQLLLIGAVEDSEYEATIRRRIAELGISEQVSFMGHAEQPWSLVSPSDIVVQPSITEVFSLVACEAAKLGLRMVLSRNASSTDLSTAVGGIPLYDLGDVRQLASTLSAMVADPDASLLNAALVRDVARVALSLDKCYASIVEAIAQPDPRTPSSLRHLATFLTQSVSGRDAEVEVLRQQITQSSEYIRGLEMAANVQRDLRHVAEQQLEEVRRSRRWRLAGIIAAPATVLRRLMPRRDDS